MQSILERKAAVIGRWLDLMDAHGDPQTIMASAYLSSVPALLLYLPTPSTKSGLKTSSPRTVSADFWTTSLLGGPICRGSTRRGSLGGQIAPSLGRSLLGTECGEHLRPHNWPDLLAEAETLCENLSFTVGCVWAQGPSVGRTLATLDLSGNDMVGCHTEAVPFGEGGLGIPEAENGVLGI